MSLYITLKDLKTRLQGKVAFDDTGADENKMSAQLAYQLINQAEGDVELDLSPRFAAPFQTDDGHPFQNLPARPTKQVIKTLCLNKAVIYVLDTDFGRGSATDGDNYGKGLEKQYKSIVDRLMAREEDSFRTWKYPPLPGLRLSPHNEASDDGYAGQIYKTDSGEGSYAADSVNDPSTTFWNATESDIVSNEGGFNTWDPNA